MKLPAGSGGISISNGNNIAKLEQYPNLTYFGLSTTTGAIRTSNVTFTMQTWLARVSPSSVFLDLQYFLSPFLPSSCSLMLIFIVEYLFLDATFDLE